MVATPLNKLILIIGGARSGKSAFGERLAARLSDQVLYVATAQALDEEMRERIHKHRAARPPHWQTLEASLQVEQAIEQAVGPAELVLLDCLTLLVSNVILQDGDDVTIETARPRVEAEIEGLLRVSQKHSKPIIIVSNEVGMGVIPPYPLGRIYQDLLGWANQRVAAQADQVYLLIAGLPVEIKHLSAEVHGGIVSSLV
jgi:adenosylcobinamide kinase / adenosylcobinamide-phosphate guanylyltransferase